LRGIRLSRLVVLWREGRGRFKGGGVTNQPCRGKNRDPFWCPGKTKGSGKAKGGRGGGG